MSKDQALILLAAVAPIAIGFLGMFFYEGYKLWKDRRK